jgi:hypothetical protein
VEALLDCLVQTEPLAIAAAAAAVELLVALEFLPETVEKVVMVTLHSNSVNNRKQK